MILPFNWTKAPLSCLCEKITDGSHNPPKAQDNGLPMLSARNVIDRKIIFDDFRLISESDFVEEDHRTRVSSGDVLLTIVGAIGRTAVVPGGIQRFTLQRSVAVLGFRLGDPRYFSYALEAPRVQTYLRDNAKGTAQKGIYLKALARVEVPVSPLAEQKRIADKLDTVLTRVDAVNARLARVAPILKRFRQSVLAAATSGRLTEDWREVSATPFAWNPETVGGISIDLRYGTSKKCDSSPVGAAVLRIPNVGSTGTPDLTELKYAEFDTSERAKLSLKLDDLLIIRSNGSVDLVGKCCVVDRGSVGMMFAGYLIRLRVDTSKAIPRFLFHVISSPAIRQKIELTARSTSGVNNINSEELRSLPLLLPSLGEQVEIVSRIETLFALADRLEARLVQAQNSASRLTPALLAKAFRGELVSQDPNDEPASELLRRLAQTAPASPSRGRRKVTTTA